jgi:hypothetical protein
MPFMTILCTALAAGPLGCNRTLPCSACSERDEATGFEGSSSGPGDPSIGSDSVTSSNETETTNAADDGICGDFHDDTEEGDAVLIEIVNGRDEAILLRKFCWLHDFVLRNDAGAQWPGPDCDESCRAILSLCETPCGSGCPVLHHQRLEPGDVLEVYWPGFLHERLMPPRECFPDGCHRDSCQRRIVPHAGTLVASVEALPVSTCEAAADRPEACDCASREDGRCHVYDAPDNLFEPTLAIEAAFGPGESEPVRLVFE